MDEGIALSVVDRDTRRVVSRRPIREGIGAVAVELPVDRPHEVAHAEGHFIADRAHIRPGVRLGALDHVTRNFDGRGQADAGDGGLLVDLRTGRREVTPRGVARARRDVPTDVMCVGVGRGVAVHAFLCLLQAVVENRLLIELLIRLRDVEGLLNLQRIAGGKACHEVRSLRVTTQVA